MRRWALRPCCLVGEPTNGWPAGGHPEVARLKQELGGDIVVAASFQLVRTLMEHDLVDELRLKIYPVVLGDGERLFGETSDKKPIRLVGAKTIDGDVVYLTYEGD